VPNDSAARPAGPGRTTSRAPTGDRGRGGPVMRRTTTPEGAACVSAFAARSACCARSSCSARSSAATTPPARRSVAAHRAQWAALGITSYQYVYELTGFFINFAGKPVRVVVRNGAVESATEVATGQPMPQPLTQWPTVEKLFDGAVGATHVTYDARYHYPAEIDLSGPPDASGSSLASDLVPLP